MNPGWVRQKYLKKKKTSTTVSNKLDYEQKTQRSDEEPLY